jgi:formiminoglutamate deiminase
MEKLRFEQALLPKGWASDVEIEIGDDGRIAAVVPGVKPNGAMRVPGAAVPGIANLHSHAFQRGMAGLAERRGTKRDSFWTWREAMYRFALTATPEDAEAIATLAYAEMLEAGFTRVGEFHYLHHDHDGRPYSDLAEMTARIAAAASETGIGLTLLPTFYAHATFGGAAPLPEQRRFICSLDLFSRLFDASRKVVSRVDGATLGMAPHSLRAVTSDELAALVPLAGDGPIHIHAAEQVKDVEDCVSWSGARSVEWLLDNMDVDHRWCLIHATHMSERETQRLASSGATAGLCPVTEGNLGDGIFNGADFVRTGGRYGVGTDSNIRISAAEELRQLEYSQRLKEHSRNVMARGTGSTGRALFDSAVAASIALGVPAPSLSVGSSADIVTLKADPAIANLGDAILDSWIFTGETCVDSVWVRGVKRVTDGRHVRRDEATARFQRARARLLAD